MDVLRTPAIRSRAQYRCDHALPEPFPPDDRSPPGPAYRLGGYRESMPPAELARWVACAWTYARGAADPPIPGEGHRVLPDRGVSVCFESERDASGAARTGRVLLMGPVVAPRLFAPPVGYHLEGVRLRPEWSRALLGVDPAEHGNAVLDAAESGGFLGAAARSRLRDRLLAAPGPGGTLAVLLTWVGARVAETRTSTAAGLAHRALESIRAAPAANVHADALGRELGVSGRHLRRVIREHTGASPKLHHRVERLARAVAEADAAGEEPSWAGIAVGAGFYDQSHLIREFRDLVGRTPVEVHTERRAQQGS